MPECVLVSANRLAVSRVGDGPYIGRRMIGVLVDPVIRTVERCYAEWVIEEAGEDCKILIGVTDFNAASRNIFNMSRSRMYYCANSRALLGGTKVPRRWGAVGRRSRGDRVGLLVERGSVSVYVNGTRLGVGPMATDLPHQVGYVPLHFGSMHLRTQRMGVDWRTNLLNVTPPCSL